jgi:phenylacetaldehyde dehydrogenase
MGPLVSAEQLERVAGYVEMGQRAGATLVTGGKRGGTGYFMKPTVLVDTTPDMQVVRDEIFGPVLCVQWVDDVDIDRIAGQANSTSFGLAASIWTRDISAARKLASRIRVGTFWINNHGWLDPAMPFGSYKQSGLGREGSAEVHNGYTEVSRLRCCRAIERRYGIRGPDSRGRSARYRSQYLGHEQAG